MMNRFENFSILLNSAAKSIQKIKRIYMERYHLSAAHTNCLCRLKQAGTEGLTQKALMQQEQMDKAQVSRVVKELLGRDYIYAKGESSYRCSYVLTESGQQIADEIENIIGILMEGVSGMIPREDLEIFYRTLGLITENLQQTAQKEKLILPKQDQNMSQ